jgi:hypothetical protein
MKDIGLAGLRGAGTTTLFTALTRHGAAGGRSNQAVVEVPDPRLAVLTELERSAKTVHAQVRFVDVPGSVSSPHGLAELRGTDALCIVLRAFGPDADPAADLRDITEELLLADVAVLESALDGARKRMKGRKEATEEVEALERSRQILEEGHLLRGAVRDARLAAGDAGYLRPIAPLTLKPWVVVANLEEGAALPAGLPAGTVGVYAAIEAETAEMPEDEARALLEEFGVKDPGLESVIAASYRVLDLITFFTTGEDESRAWEVRRGAIAPEAARAIHTDLERGFIRAEVVSYDELVAAGGWDAAKTAGKLRVEGKDYVVQEGDVMHIRFAV